MQRPPQLTQLAFVIRLEAAETNVARVQHLAHLFRVHRIAPTWTLSGCRTAQLLQDRGLLSSSDELALEIPSESFAIDVSQQAFRKQFRESLSSIVTCTGNTISLVAGRSLDLRSRTAVLADQGIRGVISIGERRSDSPVSKMLPCGLWQLAVTTEIPHASALRRWLPLRRTVEKKILNDRPARAMLIQVDIARMSQASARTLQSFEALLREFSWAASCGKLALATAGEIVTQLASSRKVRPQQSILRAA